MADELEAVSVSSLHQEIESLNEWIILAGKALRGFYNRRKGVFWRDSFAKDVADNECHPTSTNRSFYALHEYLRFLIEEDLDHKDPVSSIQEILTGVAEKYLGKLPTKKDWVLRSKANQLNMFTESHVLVSVALLGRLKQRLNVRVDMDRVIQEARTIALENQKHLKQWGGGKVHGEDEVHDFVTMHAARGLDAFFGMAGRTWRASADLNDRIKRDVVQQLGYYHANVGSKFDPAELAFSVCSLNRFTSRDTAPLTASSLECIVNSQASDGSWPTARLISYTASRLLHVASYEVALALAQLLLRNVYDRDISGGIKLLPSLNRAVDLVKGSYIEGVDLQGWANDHTRRIGLIESWTTAIVLTFLIHYRDALREIVQHVTLVKLKGTSALNRQRTDASWPDIDSWVCNLRRVRRVAFRSASDTSVKQQLSRSIDDLVIRPIVENPVKRPSAASILFHGPPGSRKTTLVRGIASALGWPLVPISPPDFLRKGGLEGFEGSAADIFDDLMRLRRVVVLFDECEDFFKARPKNQNLESRTIGAFITAGMLPRLQMLKDNRWVIFVLATNSDLSELDIAAIRPGRFDFAEAILYPSQNLALTYVAKNFTRPRLAVSKREAVRKALADIYKNRPEGVPFLTLDELVKRMKEHRDFGYRTALQVLNRKFPPTLTSSL